MSFAFCLRPLYDQQFGGILCATFQTYSLVIFQRLSKKIAALHILGIFWLFAIPNLNLERVITKSTRCALSCLLLNGPRQKCCSSTFCTLCIFLHLPTYPDMSSKRGVVCLSKEYMVVCVGGREELLRPSTPFNFSRGQAKQIPKQGLCTTLPPQITQHLTCLRRWWPKYLRKHCVNRPCPLLLHQINILQSPKSIIFNLNL